MRAGRGAAMRWEGPPERARSLPEKGSDMPATVQLLVTRNARIHQNWTV